MKHANFISTLLVATWFVGLSSEMLRADDNPKVLMKTSMGDLVIELYSEEAPVTTKNFLEYVKSGFFEGTVFHRVVNAPQPFVIQGGGFTKDMEKKKTMPPIKNEAGNGLKNDKYTLSMARTGDPNSATSQFFINLKDNKNLDREFQFGDGYGYAVFGKVVEGTDVVDKIAEVKTATVMVGRQPYKDVPVEAVLIEKAELVETSQAPKIK